MGVGRARGWSLTSWLTFSIGLSLLEDRVMAERHRCFVQLLFESPTLQATVTATLLRK